MMLDRDLEPEPVREEKSKVRKPVKHPWDIETRFLPYLGCGFGRV